MLNIDIPSGTLFNEKTYEFIEVREAHLSLEHSLISISKWESKWHKPFLGTQLTGEELLDYIKCMCISKVDDNAFSLLTMSQIQKINDYIHDPMTATIITENYSPRGQRGPKFMTSEYMYYLMFANEIPIECQKWHLNRLIMLLRIFSIKNSPDNKMSKRDIYAQNRELNKSRNARFNSKGK